VHAQVGVDGGVDGVMVGAGVHDQDLRALVSLFDHVRQVMAIFLGQGGAEDNEVKGVAAQGFLNTMAVEGSGDVMPGFGDFGGLGGESVFVALAVENLDRRLMRGRGHGPSCGLTRSLASGGSGSEITEDQGLLGDLTLKCDADSPVWRTPRSLTESPRS